MIYLFVKNFTYYILFYKFIKILMYILFYKKNFFIYKSGQKQFIYNSIFSLKIFYLKVQ